MISFSGGKDSTALLLMLLEKGFDPGDIVFFDTGWEFPEMYQHINRVESYIGKKIIRLKPQKSFDYWMFEHKGTGMGFPHIIQVRWCSREKINALSKFWRRSGKPTDYRGIAYDEAQRAKNSRSERKEYPLVDWRITEKDALKYCYEKGFFWDGLYEHFNRVSCWCCPLQGLDELRNLRKFYPDLWERLKEMQRKTFNKFRPDASVFDLEERFAKEDEQLIFPLIKRSEILPEREGKESDAKLIPRNMRVLHEGTKDERLTLGR